MTLGLLKLFKKTGLELQLRDKKILAFVKHKKTKTEIDGAKTCN